MKTVLKDFIISSNQKFVLSAAGQFIWGLSMRSKSQVLLLILHDKRQKKTCFYQREILLLKRLKV